MHDTSEDRLLYTFQIVGDERSDHLYLTVEQAMAEAVAYLKVGPARSDGSGVDTAAGWFMKMIGIHTGK